MRAARFNLQWRPRRRLARPVGRARTHLLLLREEDLLPALEPRLLPLALGLLLLLAGELLRLLLLPPLEALARLLLELRAGEEPDLEDEEELRDAIACSLGR